MRCSTDELLDCGDICPRRQVKKTEVQWLRSCSVGKHARRVPQLMLDTDTHSDERREYAYATQAHDAEERHVLTLGDYVTE